MCHRYSMVRNVQLDAKVIDVMLKLAKAFEAYERDSKVKKGNKKQEIDKMLNL